MPQVISISGKAFEPIKRIIAFADTAQPHLVVCDYDGLWVSDDSRVLTLCGTPGLNPLALIYSGLVPPAELFPMVGEFIAQQKRAVGAEPKSLLSPRRLDKQQRRRLQNQFAGYLQQGNTVMQSLASSQWEAPILPHSISVQSKPQDRDGEPHIDLLEKNSRHWTFFWTLAGDKGTFIHSRTWQAVLEMRPGEMGLWRNGEEGAWHFSPKAPHSRMTCRSYMLPSPLSPAAHLVF